MPGGLLGARRTVAAVAAVVLVLVLYPALDLEVSSWFFGSAHFDLASSWWTKVLHESVAFFLWATLLAVGSLACFNRLAARRVLGVDAKVLVYLVLVLGLGSGLVVNTLFKNGFGRPRPRNVVEFGGSQQFSRAFVVSRQCAKNCSFSSGDSSGAFFAFAVALALSRRRKWLVAAGAYGAVVSCARVASGAHFLSDTLVSLVVMWVTADALYHSLFVQVLEPAPQRRPTWETLPAGSILGAKGVTPIEPAAEE